MERKSITIDPERLRLGIELLGLTRGQLARASLVSPTTISLFLSGRRNVSQEIAMRLIAGLEKAFAQKGARLDSNFFTRMQK